MYVIGINWKPVWKHVWKKVWKQAPPIPPVPPKPSDEMGGGGRIRLKPRWKQIQERDRDDMELIRIILEFLSRI